MNVAKHGKKVCVKYLQNRRFFTTDYFGYDGQSELYRLYRPNYPLSMLKVLNEKLPIERSKRALAVDIACGIGKVTSMLSRSLNTETSNYGEFGFGFNRVIAFDSSQKQLNEAMTFANAQNIEYKLQNVENGIDIDSNCVDLVTVAQGLHWFGSHIPKLLNEIKRILKNNNGKFAVLGYSAPRFEQYEDFQEEFGKFYVRTLGSYNYGNEKKHCFWNIDRKLLDFAFSDESMFEMFDESSFEKTYFFDNVFMSELELFGYFQSMSGYQTFLKAHNLKFGDDGDPMNRLKDVFRAEMKKYNQQKMMVIFPFFLITMSKT